MSIYCVVGFLQNACSGLHSVLSKIYIELRGLSPARQCHQTELSIVMEIFYHTVQNYSHWPHVAIKTPEMWLI